MVHSNGHLSCILYNHVLNILHVCAHKCNYTFIVFLCKKYGGQIIKTTCVGKSTEKGAGKGGETELMLAKIRMF